MGDIADVSGLEAARAGAGVGACPSASSTSRPAVQQPQFPITVRFDCGGIKELTLLANTSAVALAWSQKLQVAWRIGLMSGVNSPVSVLKCWPARSPHGRLGEVGDSTTS